MNFIHKIHNELPFLLNGYVEYTEDTCSDSVCYGNFMRHYEERKLPFGVLVLKLQSFRDHLGRFISAF